MRCPNCKNHVLQKSGKRVRVRIKGPVTFDENGDCLVKCFWCGEGVAAPLQIKQGTQIASEKFILPQKP